MKTLVVILMTLVSTQALAEVSAGSDWVCEQTGSIRSSSYVLTCGIGESSTEAGARMLSRNLAIEEFTKLCDSSADCKNQDFTIIPKRTECSKVGDQYRCVRALEFEILETKRKDVTVDLDQVEKQLNARNREIIELQKRLKKVKSLKSELDRKEVDVMNLEIKCAPESGYAYTHEAYHNSLKVSLHYWDSKLTQDSESDIMWMAGYEYRPVSFLGFQVHGGFGTGRVSNQTSDDQIQTTGPKNSTQNFNGRIAYSDLGVGMLVYPGFVGIYLKGDVGVLNGSKDQYEVSYNNSGMGTSKKSTESFSKSYVGASLGFDSRDSQKGWGVFFDVGARQAESTKPGLIAGFGINYGF
jgi:hypothetical protein